MSICKSFSPLSGIQALFSSVVLCEHVTAPLDTLRTYEFLSILQVIENYDLKRDFLYSTCAWPITWIYQMANLRDILNQICNILTLLRCLTTLLTKSNVDVHVRTCRCRGFVTTELLFSLDGFAIYTGQVILKNVPAKTDKEKKTCISAFDRVCSRRFAFLIQNHFRDSKLFSLKA